MNQIEQTKHELEILASDLKNVKDRVKWLKENDFFLDVDALIFVKELDEALSKIEVKGGIDE